jgi:hypothetical protein
MSSPVLNPFTKWLVRKAVTQLLEHELFAFTDGTYIEGAGGVASAVHVQRLQVRYLVQRSGLQDDTFENTLHFINTASGLVGETASDAQKVAVNTAWSSFYGSMVSWVNPVIGLSEYRWYHQTLADPISGPPTKISNPTRVVGTGVNTMPTQMATSITMRTALRKHWGRIYFPGYRLTGAVNGLLASTDVDAMTNAFRTFVNACAATSLVPVIFSRSQQAVLSIAAVECDNNPDIIRRRRAKASTYKKILDVPA